MTKGRAYLASPFFSPQQVAQVRALEAAIEAAGWSAFSPCRDGVVCPPDGTAEQRQDAFKINYSEIGKSHVVVANLDWALPLHHSLRLVAPQNRHEAELAPHTRVWSPSDLQPMGGPIRLPDAGCFTADTKVSLLSGEDVPIGDLVGRDEYWVYSCTADGRVVPGRASAARLVLRAAELVQVTLDNNERIRCTPDHPFQLRDGTYCRADALGVGDRLMPLERALLPTYKTYDYEWVQHPYDGSWQQPHHMVRDSVLGGWSKDLPIMHHKDFDRFNNDPRNLVKMTWWAHGELHRALGRELLIRYNKSEAHRDTCRRRWENPTATMVEASTRNIVKYNTSEEYAEARARQSGRASLRIREELARRWRSDAPEDVAWRAQWAETSRARAALRNQTPEMRELTRARWRDDAAYRGKMTQISSVTLSATNKRQVPCPEPACAFSSNAGNVGKHIKARHPVAWAARGNHCVVSVVASGREDVYCLPVADHHNFALTAGVFVHNTVWEIGYAYACGLPILSVSLTGAKLNLMLALSTRGHCQSTTEVTEALRMFDPSAARRDREDALAAIGNKFKYVGNIV